MMNRLNQILIVLLVIQIAVVAFVFWPQSAATDGGPLLADFAASEVVELTLEDNEGNSLTLAKRGDSWILPNGGDFPANETTISEFLTKLEAVTTNRLVTQTDASHDRLQVGNREFNRLVKMSTSNGTNQWLYLGSSAGAGATHIRIADQPEVYLTNEVTAFDAGTVASGWIETLFHAVPQENVLAITLENSQGTFNFAKSGETWSMAGLAADEIFNEAGVTSLLNQVSSVQMSNPLGTDVETSFGLDTPAATVIVVTEEEGQSRSYTLQIGAQRGDNYVATSSESPYFVEVSGFTGNNFVNKTRADFLQAPPVEGDGSGG
ncbi:MAG: DUF4340 domain-containing protein [Chloroflexota bacterium]